MTGEPISWEKVGRYLAGESSADETAEVRRWLESRPEDARMLEALEGSARRAFAAEQAGADGILRGVKSRLRADPADDPGAGEILRGVKSRLRPDPAADVPARLQRRAPRPGLWLGFAAAAAVILVAALAVWRLDDSASRGAPDAAVRLDSTAVGERRTVRLADGSDVLLGPASRIAARGREVTLSGEAFFRVAHDPARPFTVRAGGAIIRDVGTEFAVRDDRGGVRVVVSHGAVRLSGARDSVLLARGDVGMLRGDTLAAERGAATADDLAWTTGTLVFRDASFAQVAADLKRWYGVELRVTDRALVQRHFTGSFTNEPAARVLDVLALALGARVDRQGDTAYIRGITSIR